MASVAPTRGSRRRALTRQALTGAAAELIAEKGVAGLRIQEITERADVALGSFYNHFKTKEELVEAVVADTIEVRAAAIVERMASIGDPAEIVSFACRRVIRIAYDEPELAWLFVHLDRADVLFEAMVLPYWMETLERGIACGRFDIGDTHIALTGVTGGALAVMRAVLDRRYGGDADAVFAEGVLRSLGLDCTEARAIVLRELPGAA
ncbi:MAG TPA: TetR/AcrR family transcriptional regulator [Solirubrobacteraceae bacterium]|nr:TetR/AcrR family transcriptional regulator [Solirubrobacteraceae bacterium]